MPLTDGEKSKLQTYVKKKDRGREPVFVGRKDLFKLVAHNAQAAADGDVEGRTICLAGPPGIGKTAFLNELRRRAQASSWPLPHVACVSVSASNLRSPDLVLAAIASQIPSEWKGSSEKVGKLLGDMTGASVTAGAFGFSLGTSATWSKDEADPDPTMPWGHVERLLREGDAPCGAVICLLVDEAQGLSPTPGSEANLLLASLHEGPPATGLGLPPVFAVLAGLAHTPDVIERTISHLAGGNLRHMRNLSGPESKQYVEGTLNFLGVSRADAGHGPLAEWIVGECGDFPHHLRSAMGAVAEGLLEADSLALSDLDGAFVMESLRARRVEYYNRRVRDVVGQVRSELGTLMRIWSRRAEPTVLEAGQDDLDDLIDGLSDRRRKRLDEDFGVRSSVGLMREMVKRGVIMTDDESGGCRCPIDSLISWMETGKHSFREPFPSSNGAS